MRTLLDSARADRMSADDRFEQMQAEIRQNQRLLLAGQARSERNEQRLEVNQQQIADTLAKVRSQPGTDYRRHGLERFPIAANREL